MKEEVNRKLNKVREHITKIESLIKMLNLAYWDMKITMPSKALEQRSVTMGIVAEEIFKLSTGIAVEEFIKYFEPINNELSEIDKAMIREMKKVYDEASKIPANMHMEFTIAVALSEAAWEEARKKDDFKIFEPHLEKMVDFKRQLAEYYGYKENRYDALLNQYEEGMTVRKLDKLLDELKIGVLELLDYVKNSKKEIDRKNISGKYEIEKQKRLSLFLLNMIKFDMEAGRLDETTHPFTIEIGNRDVRITTHYYENDLLGNIFSILHEGGHGLYEQHIPDELQGTGLEHGASVGMHESQSRFYENIIGKSREFLSVILPFIKMQFEDLKDITVEEFYDSVNYVIPSLIRTGADEVTYNLHIIIRYEIEKQLINEEIEVKDLPRIWNEKYKEYLGVEPKNYSEGILQDIHWASGQFGYFPTYALGNIYGGQFLNQLLKDNENAIKDLKFGDLTYINNWLKDNIHKYGAIYTPEELIKKVTGKDISTKYFLKYLECKYKSIY
ncbi:Carboxypeptidase Taq [Clostridium sp. DL-VIII]|uniref:carboxypeptidase M32 n=1 Tax=Clostridium sp. DL-VIII TaxID=641107 RepID=UPI00023B03E0|nr:carboxypeptidase M32 [Clostridium sp. DL-VIII]EHJ02397.1 Carboxypeptidase Taq [Clostridium sp. DL-VIII]